MAPHKKALFPSSLSDFRASKRFKSKPNAPSSAAAKNRSACASRDILSGSNEASSAVAEASREPGGRGRKGASGTRGRTRMSVGTGVGMVTGPGTRGYRGFFFSGTTASGTEAMHPTRGRLSSSRKADARWGARRRYDRWFRATPPRAPLRRVRARRRRAYDSTPGPRARGPLERRARRCDGRHTQIRPLWCVSPVRPRPVRRDTRALTFRVRGFPRVERSAPTGRFFPRQVTRRRASPAHEGARTHGFRPHRARARRPTPICPPRTSWSLSPAWRSPPRADTPCARFASAATPRTRDACGRAGRRAWPLDPRLTPAAPR